MRIQLLDAMGQLVATDELEAVEFKSGSRGFRANFKTGVDGRRYQVSANVVEIGTKPKEKKGKAS